MSHRKGFDGCLGDLFSFWGNGLDVKKGEGKDAKDWLCTPSILVSAGSYLVRYFKVISPLDELRRAELMRSA